MGDDSRVGGGSRVYPRHPQHPRLELNMALPLNLTRLFSPLLRFFSQWLVAITLSYF